MKVIDRFAVVITGFLCVMLVSCSKKSPSDYSDYVWSGEYPIRTENGTTGEMEDHTGTITLYFQHGGADCFVETGIVGMYAANRVKYEARWSGKAQFALYSTSGSQFLLCYSGTIRDRILTLQALNCDSVAATYQLTRVELHECW